MSSATTSSSNFQPIFDAALSEYAKQTGTDLATYPLAQTIENCQSPEAILDLFINRANQFRVYRDGNRSLINCLKPVVQVLHSLSAVRSTAPVSRPPTNLSEPCYLHLYPQIPFRPILAGVDVLLVVRVLSATL
jgi:hypothetical protein